MTELVLQRIENIWKPSNGPRNSADRVRNLSVIAHVDHGKTTLTDALLRKAGITNKERGLDLRQDEQELGVTIKSTPVTLALPYLRSKRKDDDDYCINLIDSPGHVDFSSEVTAALRLSDGALVVVDVVEGIRPQTETVLRQAIQERVRPILFLNKVDRLFGELNMNEEQAYERMKNVIDSINQKLFMYGIKTNNNKEGMEEFKLDPVKGNVAFGSGYFKYGFRLIDFVRIYKRLGRLSKDKKRRRKFHKRLWGDYFYHETNDEWSKKSTDALNERGFNRFVLKPIKLLHESIRHQQIDIYQSIIDEFNISSLPNRWNDLTIHTVKKQIEICISSFIPAWKPIVDMIVEHLPSPKEAALYRTPILFSGPNDSPQYYALSQCDPNGPLTCFVSKLVPLSSSFKTKKMKSSGFVAVTRIFSGTLTRGMNVQILGTDPYGNQIRMNHKINRLVMMIGSRFESVQSAPAGSLIGICGVDDYLSKSGTIVDDVESYPIRKMEFSVSPVVSKSVTCVKPKDLPKLVEGLKKLGKSDPLVVIKENVISCAGDFHLDRCLNDLQLFVGSNVQLKISQPIVHYMETIIDSSSIMCISKSPNKLNRLYGIASPLSNELLRSVDQKEIVLKGLKSNTSKGLPKSILDDLNQYGWDEKQDGSLRKIWSFGLLQETQCNAIVDNTHGVNYLNDVRDSIINGFHHVCSHGVLTGEHLNGVNFQLKDAKIHPDPSHRNPGQIIPCAKHLFYASQLSSNIRLKEPLYRLEITYDLSCESTIHSLLGKKQCIILDQTFDPQFNVYHLLAQLPVVQSFGFNALLTDATHGKAFCTFTFLNWWKLIDQDPLQDLDLLYSIRERNGLHAPLPKLQDYHVNL